MQSLNAIPRRRSRFWLYAPYGLLLVIAAAWSAGWFVIRHKVTDGLDTWLAAEASAGRTWECPDRRVGGYPFRIEITCPSLSVTAPDTNASLGRLVVVTQIYNPSHIIAEASGPLKLTSGGTALDASWSVLDTSVHLVEGRPQRGDLVVEKPVVTVTLPGQDPWPLSSSRLEIHARPHPQDPTSADLALSAAAALLPVLTPFTGSAAPADVDLVATVTRVRDLPQRSPTSDVERWRLAGGQVDLVRLALAQGTRRLEGRGVLSLDDLHRPAGQLDLAGQGLDDLLARYVGGRAASAVGLLGALFGAPAPQPRQSGGAGGALTPLPTIRFVNGKLSLGPIGTGVRLPALY